MEELKQQILADCNNSNLPFEQIFYILKDLYRDAADAYSEYLNNKIAAAQNEENTQQEEEEECQ